MDALNHLTSSLAGRYEIERELGRGGMALVFVARDVRHGRQVALKVLRPELTATLMRERFLREIRVAAGLSHPHILPVFDSGEAGGLLYYVMPLAAGESLRDRLDREGRLAVVESLRIARQVGEALAYAHANHIVHRDIKPENILLSAAQSETANSGVYALVADFGIARAVNAAREQGITETGVVVGTPAYMSPEQVIGGAVDGRTDLWSLACVLYEMLTGKRPFRDELVYSRTGSAPLPLHEIRGDVPRSISRAIARALATDPDERYPTVERFLADLEGASAESGYGRLLAHSRRFPVPYGAAVVVGLLALVAVARPWSRTFAHTGVNVTSAAPKHVVADSVRRLYDRAIAQQRLRTVAGVVEAFALLDRSIQLDSGFALGWAAMARTAQFAFSRGWSLAGRDQNALLALAIRASQRAVELDSSSAESWIVRSRVAQAVDPTDRAPTLHALRRAMALDSSNAEVWFELGFVHEDLLRPQEAARAWLRAAAIAPANTQVLAFLGFHHLWSGEYAKGVRWADSALALDPTFVLARQAAAYLALALRRPSDAERHAEAELRAPSGSESALPLCILAQAAIQRGDRGTARRYALRAESDVGGDSPTRHEAAYLGAAWAALGDTARALRWLSAYQPRRDLHFQLHLKRDPGLRWLAETKSPLLINDSH